MYFTQEELHAFHYVLVHEKELNSHMNAFHPRVFHVEQWEQILPLIEKLMEHVSLQGGINPDGGVMELTEDEKEMMLEFFDRPLSITNIPGAYRCRKKLLGELSAEPPKKEEETPSQEA